MDELSISEVSGLMRSALALRGVDDASAEVLVRDFLDAQMEGQYTHGIGKFLLIDSVIADRVGCPEIIEDGPGYALYDGHGEFGQVAAAQCIESLVVKARQCGVAMVGLRNASRYGRLRPLAKKIAQSGLAGVVLNNAGPPAVVPAGGADPILGTNPICFAFPGDDVPLVIDFATSKEVWGEIRQALLEGRQLPPDTFLDSDGGYTRDPEGAEAVLPFGGAKGFGLCLAIEVLGGALVGARMGQEVETQYDLGCLFLAMDPSVFGPLDDFKGALGRLRNAIRESRPVDPSIPVRVPGDRSSATWAASEKSGHVHLDSETYRRLLAMSQEVGGGLERSDKVD